MIIEQVKVDRFKEMNSRSEVYLWHFVQPYSYKHSYGFESYFREHLFFNETIPFLESIKIDYFETFVEEGVDFLLRVGIPEKIIWQNRHFSPIVLLYKNGIYRASTNSTISKVTGKSYCHCAEGITQMLIEHVPEIIEKSFFNQ